MTKKERETVKWAVRELMKDDGDFQAAVGKLARLVGLHVSAYERLLGKDIRVMDLSELEKRESEFKVSP